MEKNIRNKGITLIALVITIIILLILAGISLYLLKNDELVNKASIAKEETQKSKLLEELKIKVLETKAECNGNATLQDFLNKLNEDIENEYIISTEISSVVGNIPNINNVSKIFLKYKGYWFEIDSNLNIVIAKKADENIDDEFIIYNANGGENAPPNQSKDNNIISKNIPNRKNYVFKGWGNSESSNEILYKPGDRYDGNAPITLYAIWEEEIKVSNLQDFLSKTNTTLEKEDVLSITFFDKVSKSESKKETLLKTDGMVDTILNNLDYLKDFDIRLVPTLSSNSNVLINSQYSSNYAGYMAFDKNYGSYWCTNGTTNNSYIGYNMQIKAKVYFASICSREYNGKVVTLQCSNDNKNWKDASDDITLEYTTKTYYIKNTKEKDNGYQYWRILVKTSYSSDYVGISEAQFYGVKEENNTENKFEEREDTELLDSCSDELKRLLIETNIKLTTTDVITESFFEKIGENKTLFFKINNVINEILESKNIDRILNKINIKLVPTLNLDSNVLFNSEFSSGYAGYMAFDKNYESYWCTLNGEINNSYIGYDVQNKSKVYFASFYNGSENKYCAKVITLQCSDDNVNWKDASEDITLNNVSKTTCIKNTKEIENSYRYWRILVKSCYNSDYVGSSEVQFYGIKE